MCISGSEPRDTASYEKAKEHTFLFRTTHYRIKLEFLSATREGSAPEPFNENAITTLFTSTPLMTLGKEYRSDALTQDRDDTALLVASSDTPRPFHSHH